MRNKTIADIGEFGFIDILKNRFAKIGDDCFCFKKGKETFCVTKDVLVEDSHFKTAWTSAFELGKKAIEVNVSDIASMGNVSPKYAFIGLGLPAKTPLKFLNELYKGFASACKKHNMLIAGGDTVKSEKIIISITVIGSALDKVVLRTGAKNGELIGITNSFGNAGAGCALLYKYGAKRKFNADEKYLISKQNNPQARIKEAKILSKFVSSMTDASDGLAKSVELISQNKGADINLNKIAVSKELERVFKDKEKQIYYALFGMEDFELVFSCNAKYENKIRKVLPNVSFIGKITNSKKLRYFYDGKIFKKIKKSGYKHF